MGVYLRAKFEASTIILTSLRHGGNLIIPPPPQNEPLKSPPRLGLKEIILQDEWPKERAIADHMVSCYYCKKLKVECEKLQVDIEK